jgi:biopolymer transport protein ExbD
MKFKRITKLAQPINQISMVPMIDCVLLLLIFFMLTPSLLSPSGINVKLPKAITSDTLEEQNVIVFITSEDVIYLNDTIVTIKELRKELKATANKNHPLLIKADRRASVGRIVDVWDLCRELGIERINIATNRENS